jgi:hypothetical protein
MRFLGPCINNEKREVRIKDGSKEYIISQTIKDNNSHILTKMAAI